MRVHSYVGTAYGGEAGGVHHGMRALDVDACGCWFSVSPVGLVLALHASMYEICAGGLSFLTRIWSGGTGKERLQRCSVGIEKKWARLQELEPANKRRPTR